jgi:hypothetical protein
MAETRNRSEVLETLPKVFITGKGWFENVEVKVVWTETKLGEAFPWRANKHYVRAYCGDQIIEHVFQPYKSVGAAKRRSHEFIAALKTFSERVERTQPVRSLTTAAPVQQHWAS